MDSLRVFCGGEALSDLPPPPFLAEFRKKHNPRVMEERVWQEWKVKEGENQEDRENKEVRVESERRGKKLERK